MNEKEEKRMIDGFNHDMGIDFEKAIETMKKMKEESDKKYKSPLDEPRIIPEKYYNELMKNHTPYNDKIVLDKMKLAFKQETHFSDIETTESMLKPYSSKEDLPPSQMVFINPVLGNIVNLNEVLLKYENEEKQSFFYYFVDKIEASIIADALEGHAEACCENMDILITKWRNRAKNDQ